jgi:DNA-binding NarL/FixJ family response regulator
VISPKTARNHIEHIYAKTGSSSRAMAGLFAMHTACFPTMGSHKAMNGAIVP